VIALDTNLLVYAHREDSPFHEAAFRRVAELAEGAATWAIPAVYGIRCHCDARAFGRRPGQGPRPVDAWLISTLAFGRSAAHGPARRATVRGSRLQPFRWLTVANPLSAINQVNS
jgi:hypothetical protein